MNPQVTDRNDLLVLKSNPSGYIAEQVLPRLPVRNKVGTRNAAVPVTASTAQSGRTAGAAITNAGALTKNPVAYTCAEILKRMLIDDSDKNEFGSMAEYEAVLAWTGTKQTRDAVEAKVVAGIATLPAVAHTAIFTDLLTTVQALQPYGRVALVGSKVAFNLVRADATVIDRMKATGMPLTTVQDVRSISSTQLAAIFGADEVIEAVTDTVIWSSTSIGAIVKPDPAADPIGIPQVGRRLVYTYPGADGTMFDMSAQQMWDPSIRSEVIDFVTYDVVKIYNTTFGAYVALT